MIIIDQICFEILGVKNLTKITVLDLETLKNGGLSEGIINIW